MNNNKILIITFASIFYYLIAPYIFLKYDFDMWGSFTTSQVFINKNLISNFDILISFISLFFFLKIGSYSDKLSEKIDGKIYSLVIIGLAYFFYPFCEKIIYNYIQYGGISRNLGAEYFLTFINNGFASYLITLSLILIIFAYNERKYLFLIIIFGVLSIEYLSGMRSDIVRLICIFFAILSIKKFLLIYGIPFILIIFNRQIVSNYDFNLRSIFGDSINVMYGYSQIADLEPSDCDSTNSLLRIFVPPIFRSSLMDHAGDLVVCLNSTYFIPSGLGNSILSDINKFPITTIIMFIFYYFVINLIPRDYKFLTSLLIISMVPHIMRLGFITGISYTISYIIWILVPLIIINKLLKK